MTTRKKLKNSLLPGMAISTLLFTACRHIPEEFKTACTTYKVYKDTVVDDYIFKLRDRELGAFIVYHNGNNDMFYCNMQRVGSGYCLYKGRGYMNWQTALEALEHGIYGDQALYDYNQDLDILYHGMINSDGINSFAKGSIKKRCQTICE